MEKENIMEEVFKNIKSAMTEAIRQNIETNTIMLNGNHDMTKKFYIGVTSFGDYKMAYECPPMLLGKKLVCVDFLPDEYDFALTWTNIKSANDEIEELKNLFKKYVKCDGQSLRFKGLSCKKNIKDFEKIKELLD